MITYQTETILAELSTTSGGSTKRLTLTSWNNNAAKLDLRVWRTVDGEERPGRGVTLTTEEAMILLDALEVHFADKG